MAFKKGTGNTVTPPDPALTRISRQACVITPVLPLGIRTSTKPPELKAFSVAVFAVKIVSISLECMTNWLDILKFVVLPSECRTC